MRIYENCSEAGRPLRTCNTEKGLGSQLTRMESTQWMLHTEKYGIRVSNAIRGIHSCCALEGSPGYNCKVLHALIEACTVIERVLNCAYGFQQSAISKDINLCVFANAASTWTQRVSGEGTNQCLMCAN